MVGMLGKWNQNFHRGNGRKQVERSYQKTVQNWLNIGHPHCENTWKHWGRHSTSGRKNSDGPVAYRKDVLSNTVYTKTTFCSPCQTFLQPVTGDRIDCGKRNASVWCLSLSPIVGQLRSTSTAALVATHQFSMQTVCVCLEQAVQAQYTCFCNVSVCLCVTRTI